MKILPYTTFSSASVIPVHCLDAKEPKIKTAFIYNAREAQKPRIT
jgi:hypothetical protein